jgi:hypothetical protein
MNSATVTNWDVYPNFNRSEAVCRCGRCSGEITSREFLDRLQSARRARGTPFHVSSGSRCEAHNSSPQVRGARNSDHLFDVRTGRATCGWDIRFQFSAIDKAFVSQLRQATNDATRFVLLRALVETSSNNSMAHQFLRAVVGAGLNRIGINYRLNFIHVGMGEQNSGNVCWFY